MLIMRKYVIMFLDFYIFLYDGYLYKRINLYLVVYMYIGMNIRIQCIQLSVL